MPACKAATNPATLVLRVGAAVFGGLVVLAALAAGDSLRHGGEIRSIGVKAAYVTTI